MQLTWKKSVPHFGPVTNNLYLGERRVGMACASVFHGKYSAKCYLNDNDETFYSLEDAKAWVEQRVREWVADAGLTGGDNDQQ